ncbi:MAG: hypothetical protein IJG68_03730 [Bacilli bacterium]|nr:hypothetical protein [Bacilli bacterium]
MKKELIKNVIYTSIILLIAIISTYIIYDKFKNDRETDFNSKSLEVVYHNSTKDKIEITKVTPVTDSVGLSSNAYRLSIKNNLTVGVDYTIKIKDDLEKILEDECGASQISKNDIRISIKAGKGTNKIYDLIDLEDDILFENTLKALEKEEIVIRVWINKDSAFGGSNLHYHGLIQVLENDSIVAINTK